MAVQYKTYQDNRKNGSKLFYARAVHPSTVTLDTIADRIQHNCSMTKGDVLAVLTEMITVMKAELQNSNKVCLDNFGTFYLAISSKGSISEEDYDINTDVKAVKVNFLAQGRKSNNTITRTFTDGVKFTKAAGATKTGE